MQGFQIVYGGRIFYITLLNCEWAKTIILGVCVSVLGPDARFPDFFTRDSGFLAPCHVESPVEAALMMLRRAELSLDSGMLIAVPIPEEHEGEGHLIKDAIGNKQFLYLYN